MRFTSVGPKWRAALQSSSLSRCVRLSFSPSLALLVFLPSRMPAPPSPGRLTVAISLVSLSLGSRGAAQTAGMHQMHRADRCPSPFHRFHLFTSAVCLFSFLPPPLLSSPPLCLSFMHILSLSSFFLCGHPFLFSSVGYSASAGPLSHPLHRSAAAAATPGNGPLLYHRVMVHFFYSTPSRYNCTYMHTRARTRAD